MSQKAHNVKKRSQCHETLTINLVKHSQSHEMLTISRNAHNKKIMLTIAFKHDNAAYPY